MATQAQETMGTQDLTVVADRGYHNGDELNACEQAGITTYLPRAKPPAIGRRGCIANGTLSISRKITSTNALLGNAWTASSMSALIKEVCESRS